MFHLVNAQNRKTPKALIMRYYVGSKIAVFLEGSKQWTSVHTHMSLWDEWQTERTFTCSHMILFVKGKTWHWSLTTKVIFIYVHTVPVKSIKTLLFLMFLTSLFWSKIQKKTGTLWNIITVQN